MDELATPVARGRILARAPELCRPGAVELAALIRARKVSAREVMTAYLDHIAATNPACNAIVSLRPRETLLAEAGAADARLGRGEAVGPLHGIPQAIKDLVLTKGLRTTSGSPLFADFIPDADGLVAARMKAAGAIVIGKTNVPEFGLGSHTYNPVFGPTRNAYDPGRSAGGSSGGAAVALALRMLPVADGSDYGGSLRNPGAWNNVFGFRPSQGRVPAVPAFDAFYAQLGYEGPMGRSVADLALLLSVQAGYDARAPLSLEDPGYRYEDRLEADVNGRRIAWMGDYGGHLPFEPGILALCEAALALFSDVGCTVEPALPRFDFERLWRAFVTIRHFNVGGRLKVLYDDPAKREKIKPEARWEIEQSLALGVQDLYKAAEARTAWYNALLDLFERFDYLALPTAQVFPFPVEWHWPQEIAGRKMDSYHRWMEVVAGATLAGCPVINVPVGFGETGLPMGMQIIGRPRDDLSVLQVAHAYERVCPWVKVSP